MDSSYQQEPLDGGRVRFSVTPAPAPKASGAPLTLTIIFVLIVFASMSPTMGTFGLLIRVAIMAFGGRAIYQFTNRWFASRVDKVRSPGGTFVVAPTHIETVSAGSITREQLHRLIVRNGVPDVAEPIVVNTGSVYSGMAAGAQNDRMANRAKAATVAYMLCAEHGGRSVTLAGGMTEVTAHGLLTDVSRILSLA